MVAPFPVPVTDQPFTKLPEGRERIQLAQISPRKFGDEEWLGAIDVLGIVGHPLAGFSSGKLFPSKKEGSEPVAIGEKPAESTYFRLL